MSFPNESSHGIVSPIGSPQFQEQKVFDSAFSTILFLVSLPRSESSHFLPWYIWGRMVIPVPGGLEIGLGSRAWSVGSLSGYLVSQLISFAM